MAMVYFSKKIEEILDNLDFNRLGKKVAIKIHFGEKGCVTYINPELVKKVYNKIIQSGRQASLVETNVLYRGERTRTESHVRLAKEHGFDFAPIDILGGSSGEEFDEVEVGGLVGTAKIAKGLKEYDSLIVLSHFKGHIAAGFGGAFKNIGMGLGSRRGKLHMHADVRPSINQNCTGCENCFKNCDFDAIKIKDNKAEINPEKCVGCSMCIAVCAYGAVNIPWRDSRGEKVQKKIVDYTKGVFELIPKEKIVFINVLENITKDCDCMSHVQESIIEDIGILMSDDVVAIDKASLDLVNERSGGEFDRLRDIDNYLQIGYASERGLGEKEYEIVELE